MFNKNPEIVTILIKAGADVNIAVGNVSYQDESFYTLTPLHLAIIGNNNLKVITTLIKAGAVNAADM